MFQGGAMSPAMAIAAGLISGSGRSTDPAALQKGLASGMMNAQQAQALLNKEKADARRMELQEAQHGLNQERLQAALDRDRSAATEQQRQAQRQMDADQRTEGMRSQFFGDGAPPVDGVGPSRPGALADMNPLKAAAAKMAFESGDSAGFRSLISPSQSEMPKRSLNPFFTVGPDGTPAAFQLTATGDPVRVPMPEGHQPLRSTQNIDFGGGIVQTRGGVPLANNGVINRTLKPSETAEHAAATSQASATGKNTAQAVYDLPQVEANADKLTGMIDGVLNHEAFSAAVGPTNALSRVVSLVPGTSFKDFDKRMAQIQGNAFLQAFQSLKGGGQITEMEGAKAEAAFMRMDAALSEKDFKAAAEEARAEVDQLRMIARQRAGGGSQPVAPTQDAGNEPSIDDLLNQYGG
jgi:hypothetical protein